MLIPGAAERTPVERLPLPQVSLPLRCADIATIVFLIRRSKGQAREGFDSECASGRRVKLFAIGDGCQVHFRV